jgi:uncharacterized protein with HEPN domain
MRPSVREYLRHILDEARYLNSVVQGVTLERFLQDETLKRAFVRSLEVIGEAVKQIPDNVREPHPQIEWRSIAGMRDRLIHGYFGIDYEIVWDAAANKIPALAVAVQAMLDSSDI